MTLEKLEGIREKIAALPKQIVHVMDGTPDEWSEYESINRADTLELIAADIAEERAESDEKSCDGCLHEGSSDDECRECCVGGLPTYRNWTNADAESAKPECYPDGDKCIGCTTPPSGTTCALHGTVASVAELAKPERSDCGGCSRKHDDDRPCAVCKRSDPREPGYADYYTKESAKPDPGDVVLFVTDGVEPEPTTWKRGMSATDPLGKTHVVVLMRAAEVVRKIEEVGE